MAHFGSWEWDVTQPRAIWSPELFRIFGVTPNVKGLTIEEYRKLIHPDDLADITKRMEGSMVGVHLNQKSEVDYRIVRPDGSVRTIHSQRQVREVTKDGKLKVIVGVDQDVTEQRQAEEALKKSEERFRVVAEAANILVYEIELPTEKIHYISGLEQLTGYSQKEVGDKLESAQSHMHPDDVEYVRSSWNKAKNDPDIDRYVLEYRILHKNGHYIIVKDTAKAIKNSTGKTLRFIGGIRDITQRTRDRQQIEQYNKRLEELVADRTKKLVEYERLAAIGQVAGMVGHDIRNPLQALTGEVYLIKTELDDLASASALGCINESLDSIEQNIGYINKIIADLQDYSRQLKPEYRIVCLSDLVAEMFETIAVPGDVKLSFDIKEAPAISVDPTFLRRTLTNLINNAIQAMPEGGELNIQAHPQNGNLTIAVTDTGVGIPTEIQPKIFSPMFTTKAKGQGLGLAVVKRLVEAQGGTIRFESKVGVGTKFFVILPLKHD